MASNGEYFRIIFLKHGRWFYVLILRSTWTVYVRNREIRSRIGTRKRPMITNRKRELKFLGIIMMKVGLENLILTEYMKAKGNCE